MTREEAKSEINFYRISKLTDNLCVKNTNMFCLIDKIFDEHERENIHLRHIEDEVILLREERKTKDEEIAELKSKSANYLIADIVEEYINRIPSRGEKEVIRRGNPPLRFKMKYMPNAIRNNTELGNDYSAALIKMMAEKMINDTDKKDKARSIVAMLFWEWRKHKRMYELTKFGSYLAITHLNNATLSKLIFQQAYKMLKDTK